MNEKDASSGGGSLRADAIVSKLMPDAETGGVDAVELSGFLGQAPAGHWRLYRTTRFNEYVEFTQHDVLHSLALTQQESPLGGTRVWLKRGAEVRYTRIESRAVQTEFLQGEIMSSYMPRTGMQGSVRGGPIAATPATATTATPTPTTIWLESFFNIWGICDALTKVYPNTWDAAFSCRFPAQCPAPPPPPPPPPPAPCPGLGSFCWVTWF